MKISTYLVLLMGVCGVDAKGSFLLPPSIVSNIDTAEAIHTTTVDYDGEDGILLPQSNRNGWVNPEDLAPMPQCIAQQDQSTWLRAMTKCTSKRCTSHFGFICTHHQWLTELSCLSTTFSPDIIESYLPYCGRSVLAKAQLYLWIRKITGRTWLVDVGDTNGLQNLSPASLAEGYAAVDVIHNAPTCLTDSVSALSMEPFQHVMASCGFTSTTQHTGNAARPWEFSERLRSMIALDFETVGYDLVQRRIYDLVLHRIRDGVYFDKDCFCNAFNIDLKKEPCSGSGQLDFTKERLWINATCGSTSLPENWADTLKTTQFAYIPIEDWHWPMCVADMPKEVIELPDQCATDACEPGGYCKVKRAIDRACFCRDISYDSCGGLCKIFDTRIDYLKWLHDLCGNVQDWHGLPDNWRQLAVPTTLEMIPWRWALKPSNDSDITHTPSRGYIRETETCPSNESKLASFALVNIATFLAVFLGQRTGIHKIARRFLWDSHTWPWFVKGTFIAALQLIANWFNILFIRQTAGYENVPVIQSMFLWCSIPRPTWLPILLIGVQPFGEMKLFTAASSLSTELILQSLSAYYMLMTVHYGQNHYFYFGGMEGAERSGSAKTMYAGALMWLIIVSAVIALLVRATRRTNRLSGSGRLNSPEWERGKQTTSRIEESGDSEKTPLIKSKEGDYTVYGACSVEGQHDRVSQKAFVGWYAATVISMLLLWIAQWLFWGGFIGLSSEEFCPPQLGVLTAVWTAFSLVGAMVLII
ncbi:hypothetical protein N7517_003196 [Penicillium concentricum]|uniref:Extracellular membrane protein CFEM domain-containing protein n=1 Tax=Penicillium concentricum TaxID=293559 RepID=A0A9W9VLP7_9EURO|nr:uncharacterized protein N7517_003196 [Penicillium concentricum]KAJ5385285.1 hypothetical protein N7517_003196 [Penicillium concentricum]